MSEPGAPWFVAYGDPFAEILLACSALYVANQFRKGYRKEREAEAPGTADADRGTLKVQAKLFYAEATFNRPLLIYGILVGGVIKLSLAVYELIAGRL